MEVVDSWSGLSFQREWEKTKMLPDGQRAALEPGGL